jgi:hypothetical protein
MSVLVLLVMSPLAAHAADASDGGFTSWFQGTFSDTLAYLAYLVMSLVGWILGKVGIILNWIIVITVFEFGAYFGNSNGMLIAWGILRDIGNLLVLFGFIYAGIMMILDLHSFDARKTIPRLIIFAVLLNFSLFASELVVDASNVLAAAIYKQAGNNSINGCTGGNLTACGTGSNGDQVTAVGIAGMIMQDSYTGSSLHPKKLDPPLDKGKDNRVMIYTGTTILFSVVIMIMLAAIVMFFTRAVTLTILLVTSPIGFAGMAIPQLEGRAREWWHKLIANAFFAPVFLLIILIGLKIIEGINGTITGNGQISGSLADALSSNSSGAGVGTIFFVFGIVVAFFMAALVFAKNSGAAGATLATSFAQKTVGGTWAWAGRNFVRRPAASLTRGVVRPIVGGTGKLIGDKSAQAMGGLRRGGTISRAAAVVLNKVGLEGAAHDVSHAAQSAPILGGRSYEAEKQRQKELRTHAAHADEMAGLNAAARVGVKTGATQDEKDKAQQALQKMPQEDRENLINNLKSDKEVANTALLLSSENLKKAMESKNINARTQELLIHSKFNELQAADDAFKAAPTQANFKALKEKVTSLTDQERKLLGLYHEGLLKSFAAVTSASDGESVWRNDQIESISKDETMSGSVRGAVYGTKRSEQIKAAYKAGGGGAAVTRRVMPNIKKDAADLPEDILVRPEVIDYLGATEMAAIMSKGELSKATKQTITSYIKRKGVGNSQYDEIEKYLKGNAASWWGDSF